jgi:hypothetical protein
MIRNDRRRFEFILWTSLGPELANNINFNKRIWSKSQRLYLNYLILVRIVRVKDCQIDKMYLLDCKLKMARLLRFLLYFVHFYMTKWPAACVFSGMHKRELTDPYGYTSQDQYKPKWYFGC